MSPADLPYGWEDALAIAQQPEFWRWHEQVRATGGCADPIHMIGGRHTIRLSTGEIINSYSSDDEPAGRLLVACGNRRRSRCPSCAETYRADTYQLIKAGLVGGKGVPDTVRDHPRVFATFTAPSFGRVHHHVLDLDGRPAACHAHGPQSCGAYHLPGDPVLGQPLAPDGYDYLGAVIWNAMAPRLWHATTVELRRQIAALAGISQRAFPRLCRLSFGKVGEYQLRALVHFHAVMRLDGIDATDREQITAPPEWATVELLEEAIRRTVSRVTIGSPDCESIGDPVQVRWGEQLDIRPIASFGPEEELSDEAVAGYIAKYATEDAGCTGTIDRSVCCRTCKGTGVDDPDTGHNCAHCDGTGSRQPLDSLRVPDHVRRMILMCWQLGSLPELEELHLRRWAHMLGFGGHCSTKSRRYSTTLTALRHVRRDHRTAASLGQLGLDPQSTQVIRATAHKPPNENEACDENLLQLDNGWYFVDDVPGQSDDVETVLIVGHWCYGGQGHTHGEALLARSIARDVIDNRKAFRSAARRDSASHIPIPEEEFQ